MSSRQNPKTIMQQHIHYSSTAKTDYDINDSKTPLNIRLHLSYMTIEFTFESRFSFWSVNVHLLYAPCLINHFVKSIKSSLWKTTEQRRPWQMWIQNNLFLPNLLQEENAFNWKISCAQFILIFVHTSFTASTIA